MKKVIMLSGLPASGKSTFAREFIVVNNSYIRVNRDSLRLMMISDWSKNKEKLVISIKEKIIRKSLSDGFNVIVDDTNLSSDHWKMLYRICQQIGDIRLEHIHFDTPVTMCIERNSKREKPVGEKVIMDMYNRYLKAGNFKINEAVEFPPVEEIKEVEYNEILDDAFVVDLDGTLALIQDRSPYDSSSCYSDKVNHVILDLIYSQINVFNRKLIFMSGRQFKDRTATVKWLLDKCNLKDRDYILLMRTTDDKRSDEVVKMEMYNIFLKGRFNILFSVDDRLRVIRNVWNKLGIFCFNVNQGNKEF